jgi:hypothetical protein
VVLEGVQGIQGWSGYPSYDDYAKYTFGGRKEWGSRGCTHIPLGGEGLKQGSMPSSPTESRGREGGKFEALALIMKRRRSVQGILGVPHPGSGWLSLMMLWRHHHGRFLCAFTSTC